MDASSGPQVVEHLSHSVNFTPYDVKWIPCSARFVVVGSHARGTGALEIYGFDASHARLKVLSSSEKKDGIKCATFGASLYENRQVATGDYKGALNVYDLEKLEKPVFSAPQAHASIVNAIDGVGGLNVGFGAPEIATAGRDGNANTMRVWLPRTHAHVAILAVARVFVVWYRLRSRLGHSHFRSSGVTGASVVCSSARLLGGGVRRQPF
jgi:hypothetical protein